MVLAQKQIYSSIELNKKKPEIKPCLNGQLINDKRAKNKQWEKVLSMSVAKLASYMRENENGPFSYTI